MAKPGFLQAALECYRKAFSPLAPREAHLVYFVDDRTVTIEAKMSEAKLTVLRSLFEGKSDSEWVNILANELLQRFGVNWR